MEIINAVGRRKTSIARIYLSNGKGDISINKTSLEKYFPSEAIITLVKQPLQQIEAIDQYDIKINVKGGGFKGQAEAVRLGIARALCEVNPSFRPSLKKEGFLTRDSRMVERKKYGHKKARKSFQFSKR
ncbi:ribosomal protein S9 [Candidatus Amoebophilus asiaticus 5a2]|uniref:Small ribosomal subunit protein uS9 n=1 Tax=Amoebophilus asiaticus (strain 5a2) TaxID=452471 RepID=RS9_AMOA5|nr:30S ribosomal protein S9 [Candidatus Amoebophilus asiaticus]B3EU85.1 RecName: Full=Small ribosomal subunit protein uS9; AltName: Full=30S ribosomal protein S9 [Candidatus Amoebophilus asiaticus 5a2]ACE05504.1 ribosomal protein S9 [Candidatus Amoebophilus asiaticus 5a2]